MKMLKKIFDLHEYPDNADSFSKDASQGVTCNAFLKEKRHFLTMRQKRPLTIHAPVGTDRLYPP